MVRYRDLACLLGGAAPTPAALKLTSKQASLMSTTPTTFEDFHMYPFLGIRFARATEDPNSASSVRLRWLKTYRVERIDSPFRVGHRHHLRGKPNHQPHLQQSADGRVLRHQHHRHGRRRRRLRRRRCGRGGGPWVDQPPRRCRGHGLQVTNMTTSGGGLLFSSKILHQRWQCWMSQRSYLWAWTGATRGRMRCHK